RRVVRRQDACATWHFPAEIKLRDFVAVALACILYGRRHGDALIRGNARGDLQIAILEFRVAQPVAERVKRLAREPPVRAALHRVILERWKLLQSFVKCDGQLSRWIGIPEKDVGDRRSTFLA